MPLIPAHWRQRQENFCDGQGQPVLTTKMKGGVGEGEKGERKEKKKEKNKKPNSQKEPLK